jgi:hypothetical protein
MNEPVAERIAGNQDDHEYRGFLHRLSLRFATYTDQGKAPLFQVDVPDLWDHYLDCFPTQEKQFHNCSACRRFIREAGALVTIFPDGSQRTALWCPEDAPDLYRLSVAALAQAVSCARVISPYKTARRVIGQPHTGPWCHMALEVPQKAVFLHSPVVLTAKQRMAEMRADFHSVTRALGEFSLPVLQQAVQLLETDALYRGEKVRGVAVWLLRLQELYTLAKTSQRKANLVWAAIATAPQAYCHVRNSVVGSLLEDLASSLPFDQVAAKFKAKMHPLTYQRPQAPPSAGNIAMSERLIAQLGVAASLRRRYARREELDTLWTPKAVEVQEPVGVFGGVVAKQVAAPESLPRTVSGRAITWRKFTETVLPTAHSIAMRIPEVAAFAAYTTASDPDAPPILQWDTVEKRNPVDWYQFAGGSLPNQWGLVPATWANVLALSHLPCRWNQHELYKHFGLGVLFVLEGCRPRESPGLCLFPEGLKSELHSARKTIEAYSRANRLTGIEEASACGILLQPNSTQLFPHIRVTTGTHIAQYAIDRWD